MANGAVFTDEAEQQATDEKGPLVAWLSVVKALHEEGLELPVNLKVCFEGMDESGSTFLEELIARDR